MLVSLSLLLFAIALIISPGWRRKAVRAYGIGFIAAGALGLAAISMLGDTVVGSLARTEASEPAIEETWTIGTTLLARDRRVHDRLRRPDVARRAARGPHARRHLRSGASWRPYLREPGFAYGGLLLLLGVGILWWAPTPATRNPVTAILLAILIAIGFEGLRRQTAREFPDADRKVAEQHGRERLARASASSGSGRARRRSATAAPGRLRTDERFEQLEQLGRLHDSGTLDDDEFRAEKQRILSESAH